VIQEEKSRLSGGTLEHGVGTTSTAGDVHGVVLYSSSCGSSRSEVVESLLSSESENSGSSGTSNGNTSDGSGGDTRDDGGGELAVDGSSVSTAVSTSVSGTSVYHGEETSNGEVALEGVAVSNQLREVSYLIAVDGGSDTAVDRVTGGVVTHGVVDGRAGHGGVGTASQIVVALVNGTCVLVIRAVREGLIDTLVSSGLCAVAAVMGAEVVVVADVGSVDAGAVGSVTGVHSAWVSVVTVLGLRDVGTSQRIAGVLLTYSDKVGCESGASTGGVVAALVAVRHCGVARGTALAESSLGGAASGEVIHVLASKLSVRASTLLALFLTASDCLGGTSSTGVAVGSVTQVTRAQRGQVLSSVTAKGRVGAGGVGTGGVGAGGADAGALASTETTLAVAVGSRGGGTGEGGDLLHGIGQILVVTNFEVAVGAGHLGHKVLPHVVVSNSNSKDGELTVGGVQVLHGGDLIEPVDS